MVKKIKVPVITLPKPDTPDYQDKRPKTSYHIENAPTWQKKRKA
jgi:hypothetical protein